jgi:hypothetical protein
MTSLSALLCDGGAQRQHRTPPAEVIDMGKRDTSGDGQLSKPDPSKWEKPHDYGEGKHAGQLEDDDNDDHGNDDG